MSLMGSEVWGEVVRLDWSRGRGGWRAGLELHVRMRFEVDVVATSEGQRRRRGKGGAKAKARWGSRFTGRRGPAQGGDGKPDEKWYRIVRGALIIFILTAFALPSPHPP